MFIGEIFDVDFSNNIYTSKYILYPVLHPVSNHITLREINNLNQTFFSDDVASDIVCYCGYFLCKVLMQDVCFGCMYHKNGKKQK